MINIEGINYSKTETGNLWQQAYVAKHTEVYPDHEFEKYEIPEMQCMICLEPGNCFDTWKCDLCSLTLHSSCVNGHTEIINKHVRTEESQAHDLGVLEGATKAGEALRKRVREGSRQQEVRKDDCLYE